MHGQKAIVKTAKLYYDTYAVAKLEEDQSKEERQIVGWALTHPDPNLFKMKLQSYDQIEGFNERFPD